jgi:hypothetical protein
MPTIRDEHAWRINLPIADERETAPLRLVELAPATPQRSEGAASLISDGRYYVDRR